MRRTVRGTVLTLIAVASAWGVGACGVTHSTATRSPTPSATSTADKHREAAKIAEGTLLKVDGSSITVHTAHGDRTFDIGDDVIVRIDQAPATISNLRPGMRVTLFDQPGKKAATTRPSGSPAHVRRIVARTTNPTPSGSASTPA